MTESAVTILYTIVIALKGPVVVALLLGIAWTLFTLGWFLREKLRRRRFAARFKQRCETLAVGEAVAPTDLLALLADDEAPEIARAVHPAASGAADNPPEHLLETLLLDMEFEAERRLSRLRVGLRLGPALGLMGTLIPMGPALVAVAQQNLTGMSGELIIAFSTTVAGLLVSSLCWVMLMSRQRWYARDMAEIEQLAARALGEAP